jgi:hypothetical protein
MPTEAEQLTEKALWSARNRTIEADLRSDLAQVLMPYVLQVVGLSPEQVRQEGTGRAGRFDSMFGEAIIEYKSPQLLRSQREKEIAAGQALSYLEDETLGARVVIITDGETWGILRDIEAQPELGEQITLDLGTEELVPPVARFAWRSASAETSQAVLDLLTSLKASAVDSRSLIAFLGPGRAEIVELLERLAQVLGDRGANERTDTLFTQWIRSAGIAYGIADADAKWPRRPTKDRILGDLYSTFQDRTFAETVYVLHTYVALAAKLVAAEVLAFQNQQPDWRPSQWAHLDRTALVRRLLRLESGELSDQLGAPGLLASDLFDWYAHDAEHDPELLEALRHALALMSRLAWARIANAGGMKIDLLRDLYQSVVPRPLRKSLGEFFTPRWLAEYVFAQGLTLAEGEDVELSTTKPLPRILDPSCGSGTFLVAAMRTGLRRLDQQEQGENPVALEALTNAVIGFDINPVSALMSRVNLLLALGDRAGAMAEVSFRIYQADSIVLPRVETQLEIGDGGDVVTVSTAVGDFRLAAVLMTPDRMAVLRRNLESSLRSDSSPELFLRALKAELANESDLSEEDQKVIASTAGTLFDDLVRLRDEERDDVWARVLEQFVAPYFLEPVDLVVGNPPWVSWKNLPDAWKERSEPIWRGWGLWRTRSGRQGAPLSDISTLLVARSLVTYAPNGVVAMLLPQSAQLADPGGNAFRRSRLRPDIGDNAAEGNVNVPFRVLRGDDFVSINPFSPDAANMTIALYFKPSIEPSFPIPFRVWRRVPRARLRSEWSWQRANQVLIPEDTSIEPVDSHDVTSPWGRSPEDGSLPLRPRHDPGPYALGRGYETRGLDGLFTFEVLTARPEGDRRHIRVQNDPEAGDNTRDEEPRQGVVEADLLWPLVKGEDVTRWNVATTGRYWFVPYTVAHGEAKPVTVDDLAQTYTRTFRYVQPWLGRYGERSMYQATISDEFPWALSGPIEHLQDEGALLFVRYIGAPVAAVREPLLDEKLGRKTLPIPNNKSNIFYASSSDEAYFLAALINSSPAQRALARFAVSTGVTPAAIARLPIPRFDPDIPSHFELANAGRSASEAALAGAQAEDLAEIEQHIDELVWSVAGSVVDVAGPR